MGLDGSNLIVALTAGRFDSDSDSSSDSDNERDEDAFILICMLNEGFVTNN